MKRKLLLPVVVLCLVSIACSFSSVIGSQATATPVPPTEAPTAPPVVEVPTATELPPTEVPTYTAVPTAEAPAGPTATAVPVGPEPFTEDFNDTNPSGWKFLYVAGTERGNKIFVEDGKLKFNIATKETYAYVYNENVKYQDVIVSADVTNQGDNDNGMVLTCRMSEKGWYEFRVSSLSMIFLYRYDQVKKDHHENPYTALIPQTVIRQINPGFKLNKLALACIGNELHVYVNGTELIYQNQVVTDDTYTDGYVGIGSMSYTTSHYPVKVDFEQVSAKLP